MKPLSFLFATLLFLESPLVHLQAATLWQIGVDNNATPTSEMDPEYEADDFYYLHAGDYRNVRGYTNLNTLASGVDRTILGPEVMANGAASPEGFERALTAGDPANNVFFQLSSSDLELGQLKFTLDLLTPQLYANPVPGGTRPDAITDIAVYFNEVLIGTQMGITSATLLEFTFAADAVNAIAGSNVISILRTGGAIPQGWSSSYISIDYLRLESVPEPSKLLLTMGGCLFLALRRKR